MFNASRTPSDEHIAVDLPPIDGPFDIAEDSPSDSASDGCPHGLSDCQSPVSLSDLHRNLIFQVK